MVSNRAIVIARLRKGIAEWLGYVLDWYDSGKMPWNRYVQGNANFGEKWDM